MGPLRPVRRLLGRDLRGSAMEEATSLGLPSAPPVDDRGPVTDEALAHLPEPVQRWMRAAGVVGHPPDWSFAASFGGRFRMRPDQGFMPCETWQYSSALEVARIFHMRIDLAGVVPMVGRDTYARGHGRMLGKLVGLAKVADGSGPEFDIGELTTYLNDAVLWAPSSLLRLPVTFTAIDDSSFEVVLTDAGRTVSARVFLDEDDLPRDFSTTDRYASLPDGLVQAEWTTPVSGRLTVDGRTLPARGAAVWHLPEGPFIYAELALRPHDIEFDVAPGSV